MAENYKRQYIDLEGDQEEFKKIVFKMKEYQSKIDSINQLIQIGIEDKVKDEESREVFFEIALKAKDDCYIKLEDLWLKIYRNYNIKHDGVYIDYDTAKLFMYVDENGKQVLNAKEGLTFIR